jgi:hypothetical protein
MRYVGLIAILAGAAFGQTMTEFGAAAAVGTVSGANGQNVSKGLTAIFGKVNEQTVKAAGKGETPSAAFELGPGQPKSDASGVPLPPPPSGRRAAPFALPVIAQIAIPAEAMQMQTLSEVAPTLPPPPEMSPQNLKTVATGMSRADLLRLGAPASKITMDEDGHTVEIYSYRQQGQKIGTVRLNNGAVASVE